MYRLYLLLFIAGAKATLSSETFRTPKYLDFINQARHGTNITKIDKNYNKNPILLITNKQDNEKIKKTLDKFTMERRKTNFLIPGNTIDNNIQKLNEINKRNTKSSNTFEDPSNSYFYKDPRLFSIMNKQTVLMSRLLQFIQNDKEVERTKKKKKKKNDFEDLLNEIDLKHKIASHEDTVFGTLPSNRVNNTQLTTKKLSTVMTMIDETEVRRALKSDPYVKRILKMASIKREKYFKKAKQYLNTTRQNTGQNN